MITLINPLHGRCVVGSDACVLPKNVSEGCRLCVDVSACAAESRNP